MSVLCLLVITLTGCATRGTGGPPASGAGSERGEVASAAPQTAFVVVGDSITAGDQALEGSRIVGEQSWVPATEGAPLVLVGGWAVPGSTTAAMLDGSRASDADVAVILGGTNDVARGVGNEEVVTNIAAIAVTTEVPLIVVVAVPPQDAHPALVLSLNAALHERSAEEGWTFVDPWRDVSESGSFIAGTSDDGVHPTQTVADDVGRQVRASILRATGAS